MTFRDPDENELYEARLKYRRDEAARMEAAVQEAVETAVQEAAEAAAEALDKGELIGEIRIMQKLLKRNPSDKAELAKLSQMQLSAMVRELEQELNQKDA